MKNNKFKSLGLAVLCACTTIYNKSLEERFTKSEIYRMNMSKDFTLAYKAYSANDNKNLMLYLGLIAFNSKMAISEDKNICENLSSSSYSLIYATLIDSIKMVDEIDDGENKDVISQNLDLSLELLKKEVYRCNPEKVKEFYEASLIKI